MADEIVMHLAARASYVSELRAAAQDFWNSFKNARIWRVLAMNDILGRYRGSLIGPFWITLTQAAFVGGIGVLYSQLFKMSTREYVPLLANGVILWSLFSGIVLEGCDAFIQGAGVVRQTALPLPMFIWRVTTRNLIIFAHQAVVLVVLAVIFGYVLQIQYVWAVLGLTISVINVAWMALLCGIACTRFRDLPQVVASILQMLLFLTPVLWDPKQVPRAAALLSVNPFYHMLRVTRDPLLGHAPSLESFAVLLALGIIGWAVSFAIFAAVRRRVVHYL